MNFTRFTLRRQLLARFVDAGLLLAMAGAWTRSSPAHAKANKSEYMYQDHPQRGNSCNQCKFFQPDKHDSSAGSCEIVEGAISGSGWCMAFARRSGGEPAAK